MSILNIKQRYLNVARAYAQWASIQSKAPLDLLVLGLGPLVALGLASYALLWAFPMWGAYVFGAFVTFVVLTLAYQVLRRYALRYGRK